MFGQGLRGPNQAEVIGAKAMIGIALAATMYGISAVPRGRQRASASAVRTAKLLPSPKPARASLKVIQAALEPLLQSVSRSFQKVLITAEKRGSRKLWMCST